MTFSNGKIFQSIFRTFSQDNLKAFYTQLEGFVIVEKLFNLWTSIKCVPQSHAWMNEAKQKFDNIFHSYFITFQKHEKKWLSVSGKKYAHYINNALL